ncbi:hypothetical protein L6164_011010 [Bauhinia variegata]|uniref:Uncharacterized protein n=1 Tax=Bauhinia variegata TaxID=167791 RepID=A0ACB9P5T7_BAUVA|nr:hypothetical protein L6164_011010 [Bauhinia variegata]
MAVLAAPLKQLPRSVEQLFSSLPSCLFVCLITFYFVFKLKSRSKHNLPPSPPKLPVIGNLHQLGTLLHRSFASLSQKYGPIMLLHLGQTPTVVLSSADLTREMVKTYDVVFSSRPQTTGAKIFLHGGKDVAFAPYGEEWRQKRKFSVLELLSMKRVLSFQSIREEEVADLVDEIREASVSNDGCTVNLSEKLIAASNNIVSRSVLGHKYSKRDSKSKFGELARRAMTEFAAFCVGDFFPSLSLIDVVRGLVPKMKATFGELDAFFDEVIAEHKKLKRDQDDSDEKDFVDILLQLQQDCNPDFELTQETFKAILMDMFVGGSDTTSTTLEWAFAELLKSPVSLKKAQEEDVDMTEMYGLTVYKKEALHVVPIPYSFGSKH